MNYVLIIMMLLCFFSSSISNAETKKELSPKAQELNRIYNLLEYDPYNEKLQEEYLNNFPKEIEEFKKIFDPEDFSELYDGYEYIFLLGKLSKNHPKTAGSIIVDLAKEAKQGCCDAWSHLRRMTALFACGNPKVFASLLDNLTSREVENIAKFLVDHVVNFKQYEPHTEMINRLRKIGKDELANIFEKAKIEQMKKSRKESTSNSKRIGVEYL